MEIEHSSHDHPLILNEDQNTTDNQTVECSRCKLVLINEAPTYRCNHCNDFALHKSCADPRQIRNHPFHPHHRLLLTRRSVRHWCNSCRKPCKGFFFRCDICDFDLDTDCAQLIPTITYQGHPNHLLSLFNNSYLASDPRQICSVCQCNCNGLVLRCVPCQFNLHVRCLPSNFKHKNHIHPLILTEAVVEDDDDGSNEFWCDACEERRDPHEPVFYCADCHYVSHIGCLISEVFGKQESDVATSSGKLGSVNTTDPTLSRMDEDIAKLRIDLQTKMMAVNQLNKEVETIKVKLESLKSERAKYTGYHLNQWADF